MKSYLYFVISFITQQIEIFLFQIYFNQQFIYNNQFSCENLNERMQLIEYLIKALKIRVIQKLEFKQYFRSKELFASEKQISGIQIQLLSTIFQISIILILQIDNSSFGIKRFIYQSNCFYYQQYKEQTYNQMYLSKKLRCISYIEFLLQPGKQLNKKLQREKIQQNTIGLSVNERNANYLVLLHQKLITGLIKKIYNQINKSKVNFIQIKCILFQKKILFDKDNK
ncbi:hypothetical protein TTHERM_000521989 (macronuclear) [Tetrahymena thermophila SB210]|uniref:Uncharacterized protein n=1 Tax=Tetrahymena thermophila (strain SB210) TaxID=312017 RepID=W7XII2_TETTS|nr:hypothetical protein TTHERM_000521989 [Tetrahymena thermophila SB210]EWS74676.1 hypothetical protein TTHERM_000521989 [Tetrahymena thermophila SB210]|eukprot:XP_012652766.1 hypothetical protein TTHERM_000521989 [Tetrahymena thermophila SB210]